MMISTIIGVVGAVLVLGAFIAGQMHKLKDTDRLYDGLNVIGSGMLLRVPQHTPGRIGGPVGAGGSAGRPGRQKLT